MVSKNKKTNMETYPPIPNKDLNTLLSDYKYVDVDYHQKSKLSNLGALAKLILKKLIGIHKRTEWLRVLQHTFYQSSKQSITGDDMYDFLVEDGANDIKHLGFLSKQLPHNLYPKIIALTHQYRLRLTPYRTTDTPRIKKKVFDPAQSPGGVIGFLWGQNIKVYEARLKDLAYQYSLLAESDDTFLFYFATLYLKFNDAFHSFKKAFNSKVLEQFNSLLLSSQDPFLESLKHLYSELLQYSTNLLDRLEDHYNLLITTRHIEFTWILQRAVEQRYAIDTHDKLLVIGHPLDMWECDLNTYNRSNHPILKKASYDRVIQRWLSSETDIPHI